MYNTHENGRDLAQADRIPQRYTHIRYTRIKIYNVYICVSNAIALS